MWLAGGVVAAIGGLVFCELGTMIPKSGAEVTYIRRIYGPLPAFLSVWLVHFLLRGMGIAIGVLGFSRYFWSLFYGTDVEVPWWLTKLVALTVTYAIVALVALKPTLTLKFVVVFTAAKFLALVIIIVAGLVYLLQGHTENIALGFTGTNTDPKSWGDAWSGIIWSYLGWEQICIVTSEIQNPQRNIPIIVGVSVTVVTILYILTVTSYHIVLPLSVMIQDVPVAAVFGSTTMGEVGRVLLALAVVISSLGNVQCTFLTSSRYIHAGAVEGLLPGVLGLVSKRFKTPIVSVIYLTCVTTVFILVGDIDYLIGSASFTTFPFFVACAVGVVVMRRTAPTLARPYRVPLIFPVLFIAFGLFVFVTPFLSSATWLISVVWVVVLLCGVPIYYLLVKDVMGVQCIGRGMGEFTRLVARVLDCE